MKIKSITNRIGYNRVRNKIKSETVAARKTLSIATSDAYTVWEEPNRAETPPLHIADSGERYSTLTGVWWLDNDSLIVDHRSGLRMAVFQLKDFEKPVWIGEIEHLTDDIAAKKVNDNIWEIAVSGCWDCIASTYQLVKDPSKNQYSANVLKVEQHSRKDFCHGVAYDHKDQLCWSIHTGKNPRIKIGEDFYKLPAPWGARDICYDAARKRYISVAVSANPSKKSYTGATTTIWVLPENANKWECISAIDNLHSDAVDVWNDQIWIPDQLSDRLLALDAESGDIISIFGGDCFDFPHGLGISPEGKIAVTNYGSSSVVVLDAEKIMS